jgi:CheY-like chemotaxis protein
VAAAAPAAPPAPDAYLLVVEDDPVSAGALGDAITSQGLSWQRASDGRSAIELCKRRPPAGIILDVQLPDLDGWQVMDQLRADPATANIPVHFISAADAAERALAMGAVGFLAKPATRSELAGVVGRLTPRGAPQAPRVLIVEPDPSRGDSLLRELAAERLHVTHVVDAGDAINALGRGRFACMIVDLQDPTGVELLRSVRQRFGADAPSIIVYTALPLSKEVAKQLEACADAVVLKEGSSSERLLDEVAGTAAADAAARTAAERAARGQARAGRGRRHAHRVRAVRHAARQGRRGAGRGHRNGGSGHSRPRGAGGCRADGHHDARDGRL